MWRKRRVHFCNMLKYPVVLKQIAIFLFTSSDTASNVFCTFTALRISVCNHISPIPCKFSTLQGGSFISEKHELLLFTTQIPWDHILEEFCHMHESKCLNEKEDELHIFRQFVDQGRWLLCAKELWFCYCLLRKMPFKALAPLVIEMAKTFIKCETSVAKHLLWENTFNCRLILCKEVSVTFIDIWIGTDSII